MYTLGQSVQYHHKKPTIAICVVSKEAYGHSLTVLIASFETATMTLAQIFHYLAINATVRKWLTRFSSVVISVSSSSSSSSWSCWSYMSKMIIQVTRQSSTDVPLYITICTSLWSQKAFVYLGNLDIHRVCTQITT